MRAPSKNRRPWPMKWVALAILVVIVPFTYLTLRYRKEAPAFRPYEDMQQRANVVRLLSAGYQRIPLPAERPADPLAGPTGEAVVGAAAGGLPPELRATLVAQPLLPKEITRVSAAPQASAMLPYSFRFACTLPDHKRQLAGADLYMRGEEIVITPDYEKLSGELLARSTDNIIQLTVPPGSLKPGRYRMVIAGQQTSQTWMLQVK